MATQQKGAAAIFAAKLFFLASGYVLVGGLSRLLTQEEFGRYGVVFGVVSLINMVLINGTMQGVGRYVANRPEQAHAIRRRAFRDQALLCFVGLGAYLLLCPVLADFLNDDSLVPLLRLSTLIMSVYAFYAINVGYLNGLKRFTQQATLDISFTAMRTGFMLTLAWMGYGLVGAISGFALAAACVFVGSFLLAGFDSFTKRAKKDSDSLGLKNGEFVRFAVSMMGVALLLNLIMQSDLFLLKRMSPAEVADTRSGLYNAAQQVARIPYYLMATASLVLFPIVASPEFASKLGGKKRADIVSQSMTGLGGLLAGMAAVTAPIADRIILVLYPSTYSLASPALVWLIVGLVALSLVNVAISMISSSGQARLSVGLLVFCLAVQAGLATFLIPRFEGEGAAMATAIASVSTLIGCGWGLRRHLHMRIAPRVVLVVPIASAISGSLAFLASGLFAPSNKLMTILVAGVAYGVHLAVLLLGGVLLGARAHVDRILLVTKPLEPPYNDGSKVLAREIVERLPKESIAICSTRAGSKNAPDELESIAVYSSSQSFVGRRLQNARVFLYLIACRYHYRALHFFFAPNPMTCRAIKLLRLISPGVQMIQTVMSRPKSYDGAKDLVFGDIITAQSQQTAKTLADASGRQVKVIRPGTTLPIDSILREKALEALSLSADEFHLLFAGDIDEGGALEHLANIAPALLEKDRSIRLHLSIRTKGPATKDRAHAFVQQHLMSFQSRVSIYVDHQPFSQLLDAQDAMILPAEHLHAKVDAPLVVLETLARGKPVFMLDRAPLDEILPAGLRSRLMSRDSDGLVERILEHVKAPGDVSMDQLKQHVSDEFDISKIANAYKEIHDAI